MLFSYDDGENEPQKPIQKEQLVSSIPYSTPSQLDLMLASAPDLGKLPIKKHLVPSPKANAATTSPTVHAAVAPPVTRSAVAPPIETFEAEVGRHVSSGKSVMQARRIVAVSQPALHAAYVARVNESSESVATATKDASRPYWDAVTALQRDKGMSRAAAMKHLNSTRPDLRETA